MDSQIEKNLRNEGKANLKQANIAWSQCVSKNYLS